MSKYNPWHVVVSFVSAPCGARKTQSACQFIAARVHCENIMYVAPSKDLLNQTLGELQRRGLTPTIITSDTHPKRVKAEIVAFLKHANDEGGELLLITWSAFIDLPYFHRREFWTVVIDEVPQVDRFYPLMLPFNHGFLVEHFELFPTDHPGLCLVKPKDRSALERFLEGAPDDVNEVFREVSRDVLSSKKEVLVDRESWDRITQMREVSKERSQNIIYFLSMLKPEALGDTILLGANIEDSLLLHWFEKKGVEFRKHGEIAANLRPPPADLGKRLTIYYFAEDRTFSKTLAKREAVGGGTIIDAMDRLAVERFAGAAFLHIPNKDRKSEIVAAAPGVRTLGTVPHGLNGFQHYHNLYYSAALNREPKHYRMLADIGLGSDIVHRATSGEAVYQALMRTSLRDQGSSRLVQAIVPDRFSAEYVARKVGGAQIRQLGPVIPPRKRPLSQTERSRRHQLAGRKGRMFAPQDQQNTPYKENCRFHGANLNLPANSSCSVTFTKRKYADQPEEFAVEHYEDIQAFIESLRVWSKVPVDNKEKDSFLWIPAVFDPAKGSGGYRTQENFVASCFMVLDFDGGTLSPEDVENIFWGERGGRHSFILHSSFSRCPQNPNRFRVIFPYKRPVRSIEEHKAVYAYIVWRLEQAGHTEQSSKLDPQCKSGNQPFWIPTTNRAHPASAFFRTYGTKTRDLDRHAIDPLCCPKEEWVTSPRRWPSAGRSTRDDLTARIEAAEKALRGMSENRHRPFFMFAVLLAQAGFDGSEIDAKLREVAGSERKMIKWIPGVLRSLSVYRRI